jgi:hypothetical protein
MSVLIPRPYQIEKGLEAWKLIKDLGYAYIAGKPRSGKTYTGIMCFENSKTPLRVLVLTKKNAISGWHKFIDGNTILRNSYYVTNYEQAHKLRSKDYDVAIIDESHNLGPVGPATGRVKTITKLCWDMPHLHLSGTAIIETPNSIFHQMRISKYTPFDYKNFYDYFRVFGKPYYIKVGSREVTQYDKAKEDILLPLIDEFTVYMTQEDAGISKDLQAKDVKHYVELSGKTRQMYNDLQDYNILEGVETSCGNKIDIVCDSEMKLRVSLHMLESGVTKIGEDYYELGNTELVDYVMNEFGDSESVGIMTHFVGQRNMLKRYFKKAKLYSSTADAEGVDLSHLKHFVIISAGYSGSKFVQRRERIINTEGSESLEVHHILVKGAISDQVYKNNSKKQDFNNSTYERTRI